MYSALSAADSSAQRATRAATPFWLWPNVLSLDAPLVAIVWQDFLGRCYPSATPSPAARLVLFLAVWAIYIADRLIDVRVPVTRSDPHHELPRHRFYRRNPVFARSLLGLAIAVGLLTAVLWLPRAVGIYGLAVSAGVAGYLAVFPFRSKRASGARWKQPAAAFLFTAGVFLLAYADNPGAWRVFATPALSFAALCLGNMKLAERSSLAAHSRTSLVVLALVCAVAADARWFGAVAASAAGLAAIDQLGPILSREARGTLVDFVLLTPLLLR